MLRKEIKIYLRVRFSGKTHLQQSVKSGKYSTFYKTSVRYQWQNRFPKLADRGDESFAESYTYREEDGNVDSMSINDETLQYTYNGLHQMKKRISANLDMSYNYRVVDMDGKIASNQIGTIQYFKPGTDEEILPKLAYTYDSVGNIAKIKSGDNVVAQYS